MSIFLQALPGAGELVSGIFGESARSNMNNPGGHGFITIILILVIMFLSLTEPLKVYLRQNIGRKAFSIVGLVAGCGLYMSWAILITFISALCIYFQLFGNEFDRPGSLYFFLSIYSLPGSIYCGIIALRVLSKGMKQHYLSRNDTSTDWEKLEYRGDSTILKDNFPNLLQKDIWVSGEPVYCVKASLLLLVFYPVLGIPALLTSLSFWFNEWYQVQYKPRKLKQSYLDMRIEMQKSDTYFHQSEQN